MYIFTSVYLEAIVMVPDILLVNAQHREQHVEEVTWKNARNWDFLEQCRLRKSCDVRWRLHNTYHGDRTSQSLISNYAQCFLRVADIFGNSDTGYSDTPLTATVLVNPISPKSVTVSKNLLSVTLYPCPEGVTVTEDICTTEMRFILCKSC